MYIYIYICRIDISFGIATYYKLDGSGFEPRWGTSFSAPVQIDPETHLASCTVSTGVSFLQVNLPGYSDYHPPHLAPPLPVRPHGSHMVIFTILYKILQFNVTMAKL
jgi:hypothetical protein